MRATSVHVILAVLIAGLGCSREFTPTGPGKNPPARPLTTQEKILAQSSNTFGWNLFQNLSREEGLKNSFISPLSVTLALAMAYNGAGGETETAMRTTLGFPDLSRAEMNTALSGLAELLTSLDNRVQFRIANSIWYRQELQIETSFVESNQLYYQATIQPLDFNSAEAIVTVNAWASQNTNGRIPRVIDRIDPDLMMLLLNAIYFKGDWADKFDADETQEEPFILADSTQTTCLMMRQSATMAYFENELFQAVDLPYGDGNFSLAVFLPKTDLADLTQHLNASSWQEWHARFFQQKGTLMLPKFRLSYETALNQTLKSMGMAVAFDDQHADFSGISRNLKLFISYVKHCSFLQLDEEGTEAAAVTVVGVGTTSIGEPTGFLMQVNRPFLMIIHDHHSETALFIGRIFHPEWS